MRSIKKALTANALGGDGLGIHKLQTYFVAAKMKDIKKAPMKNCHCGQPGDPFMNMLFCIRCKRWIHAECVKCLDVPMLLGDRFYILICSVCNAGSECLARVELTWSDVTYISIYNLSILEKKKYFDLDTCILPFISFNWDKFHPFGHISTVKPENRRKEIAEALKNKIRFKSGQEIKKSKNIFGLREREPLEPPPVQPTAAKLKNDVVVWEFQVTGRSYQILTAKRSKSRNCKLKNKVLPTPKQSSNKEEVSKCNGGLPYNENGILKTAKNKTKPPLPPAPPSSFKEESARSGLLDSLIPAPPNFQKENNPFCKNFRSQGFSTKRPSNDIPPATPKEQPPLPKKRRFNGRLVDVESLPNGETQNNSKPPPPKARPVKVDDEFHFDAKDYMSHSFRSARRDGFCIIGKRVTRAGKLQYLFQKNRTKTEEVQRDTGPLFTITYCCDCPKCKILNKLIY